MKYQFFAPENFKCVSDYQGDYEAFRASYGYMPKDPHLNPGEGERFRRYARFQIDPETYALSLFPHDGFFQSKSYDVLYGDITRQFPPMTKTLVQNRFLQALLRHNLHHFQPTQSEPYEISLHMIRIVAAPGNHLGRPAPEGIHQDGYHYAAIHLMDRHNIEGAENRIHDLNKKVVERRMFLKPMDSCLFDDRTIYHSVQPFRADDATKLGYRDMLILLYQPLSESPQRKATPMPLSF